jgi:uncharacterized protein with HEPN domain
MRRDEAHLLDMLLGARRLMARFAGVSRAAYEHDEDLQAVSFWIISTIGEAAGRVSDATRDEHPEIPWGRVKGARNALVHGYDRIDLDKVWEMITVFAPQMVEHLARAVPGRENFE